MMKILPLALVLFAAASTTLAQQPADAGEISFQTRCVLCHAGDGAGTNRAPGILNFLQAATPVQLAGVIREGIPNKGMPAFDIPDEELAALVGYVLTLRRERDEEALPPPSRPGAIPHRGVVQLDDGRRLEGMILNQSGFDAHIRTADGKLHRLRRTGDVYREAPFEPAVNWESFHGGYAGNRHSALDQIHRGNVAQLEAKWFFPIEDMRMIEGTPVAVDGLLYVTAANQVYALDSQTGREIWRWFRPRSEGLVGDASIGLNRGVAIHGDRLYTVTDNAHIIALDRFQGELLWDREMADSRDHYGAIAAPLVVGDLVIAGISGGDTGLRGFLDAYHVESGERAWRFWTIPAPGEPLSETWGDPEILEKGCGATWLTGSYDPQLDLLYWAVGNPCPDLNGDRRPGDNLYTNSVVALRPISGELVWYFQFTPHDTHDWDAQEPFVLVDELFQGRPRKLLLQANRNGFFYVLDRTDGEFLLGEPFARQTWAKGMDENGRPILRAGSDPTPQGNPVCPAIRGATNWMATAYNPASKLFYLMAHEACNIYTKADLPWQRGRGWLSGTFKLTADSPNKKFIRALDIQTGKVVWDYEQTGQAQTYSGVLSTAGGLVFFGEDSGAFAALDAGNGEPLWHFQANQDWKASAMTYMVAGKQYVAIGSGMGFWAFGLPD